MQFFPYIVGNNWYWFCNEMNITRRRYGNKENFERVRHKTECMWQQNHVYNELSYFCFKKIYSSESHGKKKTVDKHLSAVHCKTPFRTKSYIDILVRKRE